MIEWSLPKILSSLHDDVEHRLKIARQCLGHPVSKGDASENAWLNLLSTYLPRRYRADSAFIVDSEGSFSEQIDIVIFDRQYTPLIFRYAGQTIVPAESVYAVLESKQTIDKNNIGYAINKASSVRKLKRTSLPIPNAGGDPFKAITPKPIISGLVTLESSWSNKFSPAMLNALKVDGANLLDIGCVASHGIFELESDGSYRMQEKSKPATSFLFRLISKLQERATVPMIDVDAYSKWLD